MPSCSALPATWLSPLTQPITCPPPQVKKFDLLVSKARKQLERMLEQAELEAPMSAPLKRRLDQLPDDAWVAALLAP